MCAGVACALSQFLRELHFIEASSPRLTRARPHGRSSFGNCTSLRPGGFGRAPAPSRCRSSCGNCTSLRLGDRNLNRRLGTLSQFLRELHFIEARSLIRIHSLKRIMSQFLRELHFIEALISGWP